MEQWVAEYLKDHESAWAPTTLKSTASMFNSLRAHLNKTPDRFHQSISYLKPYTIKTTFTRVVMFEMWCLDKGYVKETPFRKYLKKHRNRFKHAYILERLDVTFEGAVELIQRLEQPYRQQALDMLQTGVRISEAPKVKDGLVIGKGGKPRRVFGTIEVVAPRSTFYRKLKAVGLKPHTLRKLCATRLADNGASAADLCKVFGWSNIQTAMSYLQSKDDERLQALMETSKEKS